MCIFRLTRVNIFLLPGLFVIKIDYSFAENIWNDAAVLCSDLLDKTYSRASLAVAEFQWRREFGSSLSETTYQIFSHIATYYKCASEKPRSSKKKRTR